MRRWIWKAAMCGVIGLALGAAAAPEQPERDRRGSWLRPSSAPKAEPIWGHRSGLQVGLWPTPGPRGLFRIYTPYLGHPRLRMVNYISVEPVVRGNRGQSELERGKHSPQPGLAMWTADTREGVETRSEESPAARGRVERRDGTELLTFYAATEPFRNGAHPVIQVLLRADRPHEVGFRLHAAPGSAPLEACVLSATMGNYGRLRHLWLSGEVADSRRVWPEFQPDRLNFAPWRNFPRTRLLQQGDFRLVAATSDEPDPASAAYEPQVPPHWRYHGRPATHYWRVPDAAGLVARVNGRTTYWGEQGKIPGGIAYENFEVQLPFQAGQELWFGVTPDPPSALGFEAGWLKNLTDGG